MFHLTKKQRHPRVLVSASMGIFICTDRSPIKDFGDDKLLNFKEGAREHLFCVETAVCVTSVIYGRTPNQTICLLPR